MKNDAAKLINFSEPCVGEEEIEAAARVLRSGWLTQGPEVEAFEKEAARFLGAPEGHECVATSSCTAALYLLLKYVLRVEGKTVAVPSLTFAATINAVIAAGGRPLIEDVDEEGFLVLNARPCMEDEAVHVNFAGVNTRRIDGLYDQAHNFQDGAYRENSAWSFFPTKNITGGEGGLIGCRSATAKMLRRLVNHGRISTYELGFEGALNFRMTDLQAAILREQLKKLPAMLVRKRQIEALYRELLAESPVKLPPEGVTHLFWVRFSCEQTQTRDRVRRYLAGSGIQTSIHYRPLHEMPIYRRYLHPGLDPETMIATGIGRTTLSLPFHPNLSDEDVGMVAEAVRACIDIEEGQP